METSSICILITTIAFILIVIFYVWRVMKLTGEKIFTGSGAPISMAKMVLSSIQITSQILFGILAIGILCVMILEDKIRSDAGLPVISAIIGYLLGKSFKDAYDNTQKNNKPRKKPNQKDLTKNI